jgi:Zn finger protein HypA/HybF involved in hydrogenase expression
MNKGLLKTIEINKQKSLLKWTEINEKKEKACCRCNKTLKLNDFREIEKGKYEYKKYNSFCNFCDAERTSIYKNKKIKTIEGKVGFLFSNMRRRVRDKGCLIDIDQNDLVDLYYAQKGLCFYSGEEMSLGEHKATKNLYSINFFNISVDRIDSKKGYTKDNVVLCCYAANIGRNETNIEVWSDFLDVMFNKTNKTENPCKLRSKDPLKTIIIN